MAKVRREVKILNSLKHDSIIHLDGVMFDPCCKTFSLVILQ